jgi:hypothetical protein
VIVGLTEITNSEGTGFAGAGSGNCVIVGLTEITNSEGTGFAGAGSGH